MQDSSKSFLIRDLLGDLIKKTDECEHGRRNGLLFSLKFFGFFFC